MSEYSQRLDPEEAACLGCPAESVKGSFCGLTGGFFFFLAGKQDSFCDPRGALGNARVEQEDASTVSWE